MCISTVVASPLKVRLSHAALRELRWWAKPANLAGSRPLRLAASATKLWTDASNTGWGAKLQTLAGEFHASGHWSADLRDAHITLKELATIRLAVTSFVGLLSQGPIHLFTDASVVAHAITSFCTRSPRLRHELQQLHHVISSTNTSFIAEHLPGHLNVVADELSRRVETCDWKLHKAWFQHVQDKFGMTCTIDRFASWTNCQLPRFNSATYQPGTAGVDALQQPPSSWVEEVNWCNPPWGLLDQLTALLNDLPSARAIVVAPDWPSQSWYQPLLRRAQEFIRIPRQAGLFASGVRGGSVEFAPPPNWNVMVLRM